MSFCSFGSNKHQLTKIQPSDHQIGGGKRSQSTSSRLNNFKQGRKKGKKRTSKTQTIQRISPPPGYIYANKKNRKDYRVKPRLNKLKEILNVAGPEFNRKFGYYKGCFSNINQLEKIKRVYGRYRLTALDIENVDLNLMTDSNGEIIPQNSHFNMVITGQRTRQSLAKLQANTFVVNQIGGGLYVSPNKNPKKRAATPTVEASPTFATTQAQIDEVIETVRKHTANCKECKKSRKGKDALGIESFTYKSSGAAAHININCSECGFQHKVPPEYCWIDKWPEGHSKHGKDRLRVTVAGFEFVLNHCLANGNGYAEYTRMFGMGFAKATYYKYRWICARHFVKGEHDVKSLCQQLIIYDCKKNNTLVAEVDGDGKWEANPGQHVTFRTNSSKFKLTLTNTLMSRSSCNGTANHIADGDSEMKKWLGEQRLWNGGSKAMEGVAAWHAFMTIFSWGIMLHAVMDGDGSLQTQLKIAMTTTAIRNKKKSKDKLIHSPSQLNDNGFDFPCSPPTVEMKSKTAECVPLYGLTALLGLAILVAYIGCSNHGLRALWVRIQKIENITSKKYVILQPVDIMGGWKIQKLKQLIEVLETKASEHNKRAGKEAFTQAQNGNTRKMKDPLYQQAVTLWELEGVRYSWEAVLEAIQVMEAFEEGTEPDPELLAFLLTKREVSNGAFKKSFGVCLFCIECLG